MARSISYILIILPLLLSCTRRGSAVEEPSYNPHLLKEGKYLSAEGRAIPMDSATPQNYFPVKSEYLKARPPETVFWQKADAPATQPKYIPAAPRRVGKSELAVPKYKRTRGIRKAAPWPEWKPTRLDYKENSRTPFFYLDLEQGLIVKRQKGFEKYSTGRA